MGATDVGELVISLAFESGDAKAEMKALVREVGNIDTSFRALAAEAGNFGKGLDGAKVKAKSLTAQLEMQNRVVQQAGKDLAAASQKLQEAQNRQTSYKTKVTETTTAHDRLGAELKETKAQWDASKKAMGDNSNEANALGLKVLELEDAYKASGNELKKLNGQVTKSGKDVKSAASDLQYYAGQEDQAKVKAGVLKQALKEVNTTIALQSGLLNVTALNAYGESLARVAAKQIAFGKAMTMYGTVPILGGAAYAAKQAISWESSFAGVEKTVDGTVEQLDEIEQGLIDLSEVLPTTKNNLADVAAEAGQLGVQTENVLSFTKTMADLKESTNLGDEGASQMAKFANITQMAQTDFDRAGSTLVDLGNNMATTESDIMSMSMRLAGAGAQVGMNEASIMGFSAALSSLGLEAEAGGSAFSKLMVEMQLAVETGSDSLKEYSDIAGMTSAEFQQAFKEDAAGAIAEFIAGLGSGGDSAIKILDDIGISEVRMRDSLLRASNASELFTGSIDMANNAWNENTALAAEASKRYQTFASRLKMAGNQAGNVAMTFGEDLMPALEGGLNVVTDVVEGFSKFNAETRGMAMNAALAAAGIGPVMTIIGKGNQGIATAAKGLAAFKTASVAAGGGASGLLSATAGLLGPVGVAAVGAAALYAGYKLYDYASGAKAAREALETMQEQAEEWANTQATTIYDTGNDPFERFGLEKSDFAGSIDESKDWMSRLNETWTDGKGETFEIVKSYVDEFAEGSDEIREAIKARQKIQADLGASDPTNDENLKQLDEYDKEVERLLKKRQNGMLSEEDQARLDEVIQLRAEISLEYVSGEGGGYDTIRKGVEAEKARLEAEAGGQNAEVGVDLYTDALKAGAQGYQAQVEALNQSYRDQYDAVAAITDEDERAAALLVLNTRHQDALNAARDEYNGLVSEYAPEAFQSEDVQKAKADMDEFMKVIAQYNAGEIDATGLKEFTDTLDEGQLASYMALLGQLKESGLGDTDLGGGITAADLLGGYDTITDFLAAHKGEGFDTLGELFGAAEDETMRVLVDLGLTEEGQTLKDWIDGNKEFTATGTLTGVYGNGETFEVTDAVITADGTLTGVGGEGKTFIATDVTVNADGTLTGVDGQGRTFTVQNANVVTTARVTGVTVEGRASIELSGIDRNALQKWMQQNGSVGMSETIKLEVGITFGTDWKSDLQKLWNDGKLEVYGSDGAPLEIDPNVPIEKQLGANDIVVGMDEDGTYHLIVTPKMGTAEAVESSTEKLNEPRKALGFEYDSVGEDIDALIKKYDELNQQSDEYFGSQEDKTRAYADPLVEFLNDHKEDLDQLPDVVATTMEALKNGEISEEDAKAIIDPILKLAEYADEYMGVGNDISAGIADGLVGYGWTSDATTVVSDIETALRNAASSHSPARKYMPFGSDISGGVGLGMRDYSFAADAASIVLSVESAIDAALAAGGFKETGTKYGGYLMLGIDIGLEGMRSTVVGTARSIANEIKETIRKAWDINSPSGEGEWLSEMLMKGIEIPIERELPNIIGMLDELELRTSQKQQTSALTGTAGGSSSFEIDYDRLARTLSSRPIDVRTEVGGKELARTLVQPNAAERERWEASRDAGYGR